MHSLVNGITLTQREPKPLCGTELALEFERFGGYHWIIVSGGVSLARIGLSLTLFFSKVIHSWFYVVFTNMNTFREEETIPFIIGKSAGCLNLTK